MHICCRSPCGERGLKFDRSSSVKTTFKSLPLRGAWIEIAFNAEQAALNRKSLPLRGAWIEIMNIGRIPCRR